MVPVKMMQWLDWERYEKVDLDSPADWLGRRYYKIRLTETLFT